MLPRLPVPRVPPLLLWVGVSGAALTTVAVLAFGVAPRVLGHYFWGVERAFRPPPPQPVDFPHPAHVEGAGLDCLFCHRAADREPVASIPPVELCYFCHKFVGQAVGERPPLPGIERLNRLTGFDPGRRAFGDRPQPLNWVRVHRLPDHVRFTHEAHVRFFSQRDNVPPSTTCTICHGDVAKMDRVRQERSLRMGDCVNCHRRFNATTDCFSCHY